MTLKAKRILAELTIARDRAHTVAVVVHPNGGAYAIATPVIATFDTMSLFGETPC